MSKKLWRTVRLGHMVKLVYCITKKPGMTDEDFFRYWKNVHGAIGSRIHRRRIPGEKHKPDFDGVAELWLGDAEALLMARQSLE